MVSKKEVVLHNAVVEFKGFMESLYYPGANGKDFEAVRNRFYQLFTPLCQLENNPVEEQKEGKE